MPACFLSAPCCSMATRCFHTTGISFCPTWSKCRIARAQVTSALGRYMARWLGVAPDPPIARHRRLRPGLAWLYADPLTAYRLVIVMAVLWALAVAVAARTALGNRAVAVLTGVTLVSMAFRPLPLSLCALAHASARSCARRAALAVHLLVAGFGAMTFILDLPMRVVLPVVLEPRASAVGIRHRGWHARRTGTHSREEVQQVPLLPGSITPRFAWRRRGLSSFPDRQRAFLANLEARCWQGVVDGSQVPAAEASLADAECGLATVQRDAGPSLTIVCAGFRYRLAPPPLSARRALPTSSIAGRALRSTCAISAAISKPAHSSAPLAIRSGSKPCCTSRNRRSSSGCAVQRVRVQLDHRPGEIFGATVGQYRKTRLGRTCCQLAAAGDAPTRTDAQGVSRPLDTWYQVRVLVSTTTHRT